MYHGRIHMDNVIETIKEMLIQNKIPVLGIAPSEPLEKAPVGYRPSDMLPGVKSILCLGVPVPKGILQSGVRANENYWRTVSIYYRKIDAILLQIACFLEEDQDIAMPVFG